MKTVAQLCLLGCACLLAAGCGPQSPAQQPGRYQFLPAKPHGLDMMLDSATGQMWLMFQDTNGAYFWHPLPKPCEE